MTFLKKKPPIWTCTVRKVCILIPPSQCPRLPNVFKDFMDASDMPVRLIYCSDVGQPLTLQRCLTLYSWEWRGHTVSQYDSDLLRWWMVLITNYVLRDRYFMSDSQQLGEDKLLSLSVCSTVRTWDLNSEKKHKSVFKPRSFQGKKVIPTCCTYSRDGKLIAAGCQDGTIQIWDRNLSVSLKTRTYQQPQCEVGCKHRMSVLLLPRAQSHESQVIRSGHRGHSSTSHWPTLTRIQNPWL